jgi:spermidine synthase
MNNTRASAIRLFLLGFLTLFLELTFIRYLAGSVWNLGFFPNLVLMGVFIGMGVGFVFHDLIKEERSPFFFRLAAVFILVLVVFVYVAHPAVPGFATWSGNVGGEIYFTFTPVDTSKMSYAPFALMFLFVVLVFGFISQRTAKFFRLFPPLKAYTLDILGSCCGILSFMMISRLQLPAYLWFLFIVVLFSAILESSRLHIPAILAGAVLLVWSADRTLISEPDFDGTLEVHWSPYQKVEFAMSEDGKREVFVNGISHQMMVSSDLLGHSMYLLPYTYRSHFHKPPSDDVLVIGAGTGNDVAAALMEGAKHVDGVEIDPVIAGIGSRSHPAHPYNDPRVTQVVDDARAFMTYTPRKYDVIIFALTDSLVKVSPVAQLRLENYIFTEESVGRALSLLKDGGTIFFYNYYRTSWVKGKIQQMAMNASGVWPQTIYHAKDFAMLALDRQRPAEKPGNMEAGLQVPRDDWPFLYLKERGIPSFYAKAMVGVALFIFLIALLVHRVSRSRQNPGEAGAAVKLAFLFMGTAFLLLETKSVIQFSLLFGTTWLNNSLVFLSVLIFVLAANWCATLLKGPRVLWIMYALLMVFCLAALFFPLGRLLAVRSVVMRFVVASLFTFSPIFFANVIFSITFRDRPVAEHLFGWNLIGAAFGGILEYSSMALGYNALAVVVAVCYTLVFILLLFERRARPAMNVE